MKQDTNSQRVEYNLHKETRYCINLKQSEYGEGEYLYRIEKIYVKRLQQEEIRFALYKMNKDKDGNKISKLIPRPLDVTEQELIEFFKNAISQDVFSKSFLKNLKLLIPDTSSNKNTLLSGKKAEGN